MKFSEVFTAPFVRSLSIRLGLLVGFVAALVAGWQYGVLIGALSALGVSFLLPIVFYVSFLPYKRMKKEIVGTFLFDEPVRFTVKKGTVGGFLVITEQALTLLSGESAQPKVSLSRDQVRSIRVGEDLTVEIFLNEKQFIRVFSGDSEEIVSILREQGWNTVA